MSVEELAEIREARVQIRGNVHNLGQPVPRGFLRVASNGPAPTMPSHESGRKELAAWLAGADNPLTARVIVNRVWHWLFGAGLVRTVDNFGTTGERPSHPELLDDLAVRFMEDGWSIKTLVRRIVRSRTYRLAAVDDPRVRAADPENRLLGRMNRRRLDAECLRDTILQVSGQLRLEMGGPAFPGDLAEDYAYKDAGTRRSVYVPVFRNALPEIFEVFDFADPSMVVGRRNASIIAPQALFLMNDPFVVEQSKHAARRLLAEPGLDDPGRITRAFVLALGRDRTRPNAGSPVSSSPRGRPTPPPTRTPPGPASSRGCSPRPISVTWIDEAPYLFGEMIEPRDHRPRRSNRLAIGFGCTGRGPTGSESRVSGTKGGRCPSGRGPNLVVHTLPAGAGASGSPLSSCARRSIRPTRASGTLG